MVISNNVRFFIYIYIHSQDKKMADIKNIYIMFFFTDCIYILYIYIIVLDSF